MPNRVSHKSISGFQQIRFNSKEARILTGSAATFMQNPDKTLARAEYCIPHGKFLSVNINTDGIGGIIDLPSSGIPDDGIYYMFIRSTGVPDSDGVLPFASTHAYMSKKFTGYGGGPAGGFKRPLTATYFIRNNKIMPCMALSENGHNWQRFQYDGYASWKSAFDKNEEQIGTKTHLQSGADPAVKITLKKHPTGIS